MKINLSFLLVVLLILGGSAPTLASDGRDPNFAEKYWTSSGIGESNLFGGSIEVDFGGGIRRIDWPGGHSELFGLTIEGRPVTFSLEGQNELWHYNLRELAESLRQNSIGEDQNLAGKFDFSLRGSGSVEYLQDYPGKNDNQLSILKLSNGRRVHIFSEQPLRIPELENIAWVVAEAPERTFGSKDGSCSIFVVKRLGEVRAAGAKFVALGGLHDSTSGSIFIRAGELQRFEATAFVLRHESGHALDSLFGWLSKTLRDENGAPLFGAGVLAKDNYGHIDFKKSEFKSEYATTNSNEDFAETHEFLLWYREHYNAQHPGADLLKLRAPEFHAELTSWGISSRLQEKMAAIASHIYSDPDVFAAQLAPSGQTAASPSTLNK